MHNRIVLAVLLAIASFAAQAIEDSCGVKRAPRGAKVYSSHAFDLHVWPPKLPPAFTGCQQAWMGDGRLFAVARYRRGTIRSFILTEPKSETVVCNYESKSGEVLNDACPSPGDFPIWR